MGTIDLVMSREFAAPAQRVYEAFVTPALLSRWFGPVGWGVPLDTITIEPRVGGVYAFTMTNNDDATQTSPVHATFVELEPGKLIVGEERWSAEPEIAAGTVMQARMEFHPVDDRTSRLELRQGPYTPDIEDMARTGWASSFTKLDALLAEV